MPKLQGIKISTKVYSPITVTVQDIDLQNPTKNDQTSSHKLIIIYTTLFNRPPKKSERQTCNYEKQQSFLCSGM